jgi:C4-dicarboxylate-specific signal transduction histidine kinase
LASRLNDWCTAWCAGHPMLHSRRHSGPGIKPEHLDHLFDSFFTTKDVA